MFMVNKDYQNAYSVLTHIRVWLCSSNSTYSVYALCIQLWVSRICDNV